MNYHQISLYILNVGSLLVNRAVSQISLYRGDNANVYIYIKDLDGKPTILDAGYTVQFNALNDATLVSLTAVNYNAGQFTLPLSVTYTDGLAAGTYAGVLTITKTSTSEKTRIVVPSMLRLKDVSL